MTVKEKLQLEVILLFLSILFPAAFHISSDILLGPLHNSYGNLSFYDSNLAKNKTKKSTCNFKVPLGIVEYIISFRHISP